jgi:predicted ATP-dependent protease
MNQHGRVQAIGGANEKVEGFYDICASRGLTGTQGVLLPADNVRNLMLRADVVEAVTAGRFHVWAMEEIDDALALLSGLEAGRADDAGQFPPESFNGRVNAQLAHFSDVAARLSRGTDVTRVERSEAVPEAPPGPPPGPEDLP